MKKNNGGVGFAWLGVAVGTIGSRTTDYPISLILVAVGAIVCVLGCIEWALRKNRHWAFGLWGILAPIGLLGVSLLKDKSSDISQSSVPAHDHTME